MCVPGPPENCQLNVKKCQKLDLFLKKIARSSFGQFFDSQWQFSGGSGYYHVELGKSFLFLCLSKFTINLKHLLEK